MKVHIDTSKGRPRILVLGEDQALKTRKKFFAEKTDRLRNTEFITYGFGRQPRKFDHWVPALQKDKAFAQDVFIYDPSKQQATYEFDAVILHLSNWRRGLDKGYFNDCPDPLALLTWAYDRLVTGGLLILTGDDFMFTHITGSISYRFSDVWAIREGATDVYLTGRKKTATSGDQMLRTQLAKFLSAEFEFLTHLEPDYSVTRHKEDEPTMFSRVFDRNYVAQNINSVPKPFEMIRHHFAEKGTEREIRIPIKPTLGNIPKLVPIVHDVITDSDGTEWVVKGIPETITIKDPDNAMITRDMKRLQMIAIQVKGSDVGHIIKSQIG